MEFKVPRFIEKYVHVFHTSFDIGLTVFDYIAVSQVATGRTDV